MSRQNKKTAKRMAQLETEVERLRAALQGSVASPQEPQWEPIETAPKDKRVLAFLGEHYNVCIVTWGYEDDSDTEAWIDDDDFAPDPQPTHWMELPDPPSEVGAAERTQEGETP